MISLNDYLTPSNALADLDRGTSGPCPLFWCTILKKMYLFCTTFVIVPPLLRTAIPTPCTRHFLLGALENKCVRSRHHGSSDGTMAPESVSCESPPLFSLPGTMVLKFGWYHHGIGEFRGRIIKFIKFKNVVRKTLTTLAIILPMQSLIWSGSSTSIVCKV